jgi:hypothetical protein
MEFLNSIKAMIPDYAKDIRLNIDGTIASTSSARAARCRKMRRMRR